MTLFDVYLIISILPLLFFAGCTLMGPLWYRFGARAISFVGIGIGVVLAATRVGMATGL